LAAAVESSATDRAAVLPRTHSANRRKRVVESTITIVGEEWVISPAKLILYRISEENYARNAASILDHSSRNRLA
jgi:hypothetical protein